MTLALHNGLLIHNPNAGNGGSFQTRNANTKLVIKLKPIGAQ